MPKSINSEFAEQHFSNNFYTGIRRRSSVATDKFLTALQHVGAGCRGLCFPFCLPNELTPYSSRSTTPQPQMPPTPPPLSKQYVIIRPPPRVRPRSMLDVMDPLREAPEAVFLGPVPAASHTLPAHTLMHAARKGKQRAAPVPTLNEPVAIVDVGPSRSAPH